MTARSYPAAQVSKTTLPNGIRVVTEEMPHVRSISAGVWVDQGSRHEEPPESGITHFVEHMVFKGTEQRSAEDLACAIDGIGGNLDAFTTKETVAFTVKVLDEHLPAALDIISDLTLRPAFRLDDIEKEKGVVLEELKMDEDNPDYLLHDLFASRFWAGHSLGRPIIGTAETIRAFERAQLREFFERSFRAPNLLITAAGNLNHERFVAEVEQRFGGLPGGDARPPASPPAAEPTIALRDKPALEQVQLCLGVEAYPIHDPRRFAGFVLSTLLGGGYSSRLFLKIREREGLAYSVYSDLNLYSDTGCMSVYAGTSLESAEQVIRHTLDEFRSLKDERVQPTELTRAKEHLKGSLMLSLESTSSRMSNLARQEKYFQRPFSLDEVVERIESVTAEQIQELSNAWFQQDRLALAVVGDLRGMQFDRDALSC